MEQHHNKTFGRLTFSFEKESITKEMEPSHIPVINLHKADLMRTELLIQAHQKQLAQYVKQLYNMDLHIYTSTTEVFEFPCAYTFMTYYYTRTIKHQLSVCTLEVTFWDV